MLVLKLVARPMLNLWNREERNPEKKSAKAIFEKKNFFADADEMLSAGAKAIIGQYQE